MLYYSRNEWYAVETEQGAFPRVFNKEITEY